MHDITLINRRITDAHQFKTREEAQATISQFPAAHCNVKPYYQAFIVEVFSRDKLIGYL